MPTYEYLCSLCNGVQEVSRGFSDKEIAPICCNHETKRLYTPTGVIFKGRGFYKTGG